MLIVRKNQRALTHAKNSNQMGRIKNAVELRSSF